jgi:hypothetical protein
MCTAIAAGGTSQRGNPGGATVRSRLKKDRCMLTLKRKGFVAPARPAGCGALAKIIGEVKQGMRRSPLRGTLWKKFLDNTRAVGYLAFDDQTLKFAWQAIHQPVRHDAHKCSKVDNRFLTPDPSHHETTQHF